VLLKVRLDDVRAILKHALDTVAEHPEILTTLTRALEDLVTGRVGDALGTVENVLGGLENNGTVDDLLKGRLEDVRDALQEVLSQVGEQTDAEGISRQALPEGPPPAGGSPGAPPQEERGG
jgi:hypothetical protein